jgi:adenine-specific DNA-methyltransferase
LADSAEGEKMEAEVGGRTIDPKSAVPDDDIRQGFVCKRVPHVTLGSIANNDEIDTIHAGYQKKLEPISQRLNTLFKLNWEEWQYAREYPPPPANDVPKKVRDEASELHANFCALRRERQREIDASIARRADTELLFDQPYEDPKRVRVTSPFTVESLSPHRTISVEDKKKLADVGLSVGVTIKTLGPDPFGHMILENLKTTPLMGQKKADRVTFQSVEPYPGQWIQGEGIYADADGKERRAAICIGPEHGTIGPELIKEAAKEAVQGVGFDLLLVLGFAFDPHVAEEAKRYGKLTVLPVRLNPDLMMGKLLKQTKAANLFMVFGEPDIEIKKQKDGQLTVTINGLDLYDPNTGEIRSSGSDEIACWFLDTNYNGESFFVRHAYFTGANEPYEKLKRALRAEIDEAAWSALYKTTSRPFPAPKSGKLAVKVINHYGDEVLKVYKA